MSTDAVASLWSRLAPNVDGLVVAVITHAEDKRVLMLGYMNYDALAHTLVSRQVTFFSRSKQRLWTKGESSGHALVVRSLRIDCDGDALLIEATPLGPTCHTGSDSCFFAPVDLETIDVRPPDGGPAVDPLTMLWRTILARKSGRGTTNRDGQSYVRKLLDAGPDAIAAKIREEADELAQALVAETDARVADETVDLLFHAMVGLAARELGLEVVGEVIRTRHGTSGIDEKAGR